MREIADRISPRISSKGLEGALNLLHIPFFPYRITLGSFPVRLNNLRIKSRDDGQGAAGC